MAETYLGSWRIVERQLAMASFSDFNMVPMPTFYLKSISIFLLITWIMGMAWLRVE